MLTNDADLPTVPRSLFVDGVEVTEGTFVITTSDDDAAEAGEVWGVDAFRGQVLVSWPVKVRGGYRYVQDWHPITDLNPVG